MATHTLHVLAWQHSAFLASYSLQVNKVIFGHQRVNSTIFFSANVFYCVCPQIRVNMFCQNMCSTGESIYNRGVFYSCKYGTSEVVEYIMDSDIITFITFVHNCFNLCNRIILFEAHNITLSYTKTTISSLPPTLCKKIYSPRASKNMYFTTLSTSQIATTKLTQCGRTHNI